MSGSNQSTTPGHIPGVTLIPLDDVPNRLNEIPKDKPVIVTCRSGNRSGQVTDFLRQQGYTNVHNMTGGINAWQQAGYVVREVDYGRAGVHVSATPRRASLFASRPVTVSARARLRALNILPFLLQGIGYGFSAAVQPGPFQTYLISQTLLNGWRRTLIAAFAPLVSDGLIIATVLLVLTRVPAAFRLALQLAGGVFILYLAWGAIAAWRRFDVAAPPAPAVGQQSLLRAALMNSLTPTPGSSGAWSQGLS